MKKRAGNRREGTLLSLVMLFYFSAFLLLSLKGEWRNDGAVFALAVPAALWLSATVIPGIFKGDKLTVIITGFLSALGVLVLYVTDRSAGTRRAMQQSIYFGIGVVVMVICIFIARHIRRKPFLMYVLMAASASLIALPLAIGTEVYGATNWIRIGGMSVQPSEIVKISFLILLAWYMSERQHLPWVVFTLFCLLILMLQKDLGTALIYYMTALLLFYASTGHLPLTFLGLMGSAGAAVLGYKLFAHVKKRVAIWRNPWIYYETSGYQIVQALMAIASGGLQGMGLGLGTPQVIPVYFADTIFAVICEQFGILFGVLVLLLYVILILRGAQAAKQAFTSFDALIAMGATVLLGLQTFVIIGGVLKFIPLTGVTMPFVSYGGSSMVSCMGLAGLLQGVMSVTKENAEG